MRATHDKDDVHDVHAAPPLTCRPTGTCQFMSYVPLMRLIVYSLGHLFSLKKNILEKRYKGGYKRIGIYIGIY